jgi:hypothetical protein
MSKGRCAGLVSCLWCGQPMGYRSTCYALLPSCRPGYLAGSGDTDAGSCYCNYGWAYSTCASGHLCIKPFRYLVRLRRFFAGAALPGFQDMLGVWSKNRYHDSRRSWLWFRSIDFCYPLGAGCRFITVPRFKAKLDATADIADSLLDSNSNLRHDRASGLLDVGNPINSWHNSSPRGHKALDSLSLLR